MKKKYNLLLILFFLMPRMPIENGAMIVYPIIGMILLVSILFNLRQIKNIQLKNNFVFIFFSLIILLVILCISILANGKGASSISSIVRILFFIIIFVYGYTKANFVSSEKLANEILRTINLLFIFEILVVMTQLFDIRIFHPIYSMNKTLPLGTLVRVSGTFANPNLFGWIIVQLSVLFLLLEESRIKMIIKILTCLFLVFLSGSRVTFMIFPFTLFLTVLFKQKKNIKFYFKKFPIIIFLSIFCVMIIFKLLYKYQEVFPYMSQLFLVFDTFSLSSVNSFSIRESMWESGKSAFIQYDSPFKYMLGMGPGTFEVLDNDFLFSFLNFGIIFFVVQLLPYIYIIILNIVNKEKKWLQIFLLQYTILSLFIGYQSETISGWDYPVLFMYFLGLFCYIKKNRGKKNDNIYIKEKIYTHKKRI